MCVCSCGECPCRTPNTQYLMVVLVWLCLLILDTFLYQTALAQYKIVETHTQAFCIVLCHPPMPTLKLVLEKCRPQVGGHRSLALATRYCRARKFAALPMSPAPAHKISTLSSNSNNQSVNHYNDGIGSNRNDQSMNQYNNESLALHSERTAPSHNVQEISRMRNTPYCSCSFQSFFRQRLQCSFASQLSSRVTVFNKQFWPSLLVGNICFSETSIASRGDKCSNSN